MKPHQLRVVSEKDELDNKLNKLIGFIKGDTFQLLDRSLQSLLTIQRDAMTLYSNILDERIAAMKEPSPKCGACGCEIIKDDCGCYPGRGVK